MHRRSQKTNKDKLVILVMVTIVLSIFVPVFPIKAQVWTDGGTVTFYATPSPMPDLVVTIISWTPISPIEGNTMTFNTYIKNQGDATAGMFEVSSYIDDVKKSERVFFYLDQGSSNYYQFYWTATQGTHVVRVVVDLGNVVSEQREDNNELAKSFVVGPKPKPDLTVTDITWTPTTIVEGNTVYFKATVKNQMGSTAGTFSIALYVDGVKIGEQSVSNLAVGFTTYKQFTWTAIIGDHTIKAVVDSTGIVAEEYEDNNELPKSFTVNYKPRPDLIISDITWTPTSIAENIQATFKVAVKSQGATASSFKVAAYIDDVKIVEQTVSSLCSDATAYVSFYWKAVGQGAHVVNAVADSTSVIIEEHEDNNELSKEFTVNPALPQPKPDLVVIDIIWTPSTPTKSSFLTFSISIKNQGTSSAIPFSVAYYIDGVKRGSKLLYGLNVGQTSTCTFSWIAIEGDHTVKGFVDSGLVISELKEDNNELVKSFYVGGLYSAVYSRYMSRNIVI